MKRAAVTAAALVGVLAPATDALAVQPEARSGGGKTAIRSRTARVVRLAAALLLSALALAITPEASHAAAPGAEHHLYWAEFCGPLGDCNSGTIGRADLTGPLEQAADRVNDSFITSTVGTAAVAVDAVHVYWTNSLTGTIGRANLDGTEINENFITGAGEPIGVAVDGAYIYWSHQDPTDFEGGFIGRAKLDGTEVNQSFISGASRPSGVAVDGAHVYWSNTFRGRLNDLGLIGRAKLDGTKVNQSFISIPLGVLPLPCGVAVDGAHVYWTELAPPGRSDGPTSMARR
jgi:virginiamycin B lyase